MKTLPTKMVHSNSQNILPQIKSAQRIKNAFVLKEMKTPNNNEYGLSIYPKSDEECTA
jgi:hypothetical protein